MKKDKLIITIIFILIFLLPVSTVNAEIKSFPLVPPNMYYWEESLFSSQQGAALGRFDGWGRPTVATIYNKTYERNAKIEPSVGYAYYLADKYGYLSDEEMQKIIWASGQWNNDSNMINTYMGEKTKDSNTVIAFRSYVYGTVYYGIFKDAIENNKDIFKSLIPYEDVRVLVDQDTEEYTVGPYQLELNVTSNEYTNLASVFLYWELSKYSDISDNGYTEETAFANLIEIEGLNKKEGTVPVFVNLDGEEIEFPNFSAGEKFFIRFVPDKDGAICETGNPSVKINYISRFNTKHNLIRYNPQGVQIGGSVGDAENSENLVFERINKDSDYSMEQVNFLTDMWDDYQEEIAESNPEGYRKGWYNISQLPEIALYGGVAVVGAFGANPFLVGFGLSHEISSAIRTIDTTDFDLDTGKPKSNSGSIKIELPVIGELDVTRATADMIDMFGGAAVGTLVAGGDQWLMTFLQETVQNTAVASFLEKIGKGYFGKWIDGFSNLIDVTRDPNFIRRDNLDDAYNTKIGKELETSEREYLLSLIERSGKSYITPSQLREWDAAFERGNKEWSAIWSSPSATLSTISSDMIITSSHIVYPQSVKALEDLRSNRTLTKEDKDNPSNNEYDLHYSCKVTGTGIVVATVNIGFSTTDITIGDVEIEASTENTITVKEKDNDDAKIEEDVMSKWTTLPWIVRTNETYTYDLPLTYIWDGQGHLEKESFNKVSDVQNELSPGVKVENNEVVATFNTDVCELKGTTINMQIGGTTWMDTTKNGKKEEQDFGSAGIEVKLFEVETDIEVATTITNKAGEYRFYGLKSEEEPLINPLKKYYVEFTYNGQRYQPTYYKNKNNGDYSNAKDVNREEFNERFKNIESDPYEYDGKKSFSLLEKVKNEDGSLVFYKGEYVNYYSVLARFFELSSKSTVVEAPSSDDALKVWNRSISYDDILDGSGNQDGNTVKNWLMNDLGMSQSKSNEIIEFTRDTLITASTKQNNAVYPEYNQFVINKIENNIETYYDGIWMAKLGKNYRYLYEAEDDQSRFIDIGLTSRHFDNLTIQNDIYKVTTLINGKKQEYKYNERADYYYKVWSSDIRSVNDDFNENAYKERRIRKSDYLYLDSDENKNLKVYVTYRMQITNMTENNAEVHELVNYYDSDNYVLDYDGINGDGTYNIKEYEDFDENGKVIRKYVNSYVGSDSDGGKLNNNLIIKNRGKSGEQETLSGKNYNYSTIYMTGITSESGDSILIPGESAYVYVTFKVRNDDKTGRIKIDDGVGKRDIAEINSYSTYYKAGDKIPDYLDDNDLPHDTQIVIGDAVSGIVEVTSTPGNLSTSDLDEDGNLITGYTGETTEKGYERYDYNRDRLEDDMDQAPRLKLIIDDENDRTIKGYTFEDARNNTENTGKAVIGNGLYNNNDGDKKIDGVTVELVELVKNVDENGIFTGSYSGEKVWDSYTYSIDANEEPSVDSSRYASGKGKSKVIIKGKDNLEVKANDLGEGEYEFKSIPPGDFYVRFKYGDTAETTMISSDKLAERENQLKSIEEWQRTEAEKVELQSIEDIKKVNNSVPKIDGMTGKNKKSYNGQDYKTTIYQEGMTQETKYNGIDGYQRIETQNYSSEDDSRANNGTEKSSMYNYNIPEGDNHQESSDAKDVYYYRKRTNDYSKGENGNTLLNNRAEVLSSFEKMATYAPSEYTDDGYVKYENDEPVIKEEEQKENQKQMIKELMENTQMVAQTGIIDMEVEYNRKETVNRDENLDYRINNMNLGLTERPLAQLSLCNKIDNFRVIASNGNIIFDANKSVNNVFFSEHRNHTGMFNRVPRLLMQTFINKNKEGKNTSELIQAYIDDELRSGTRVEIKYKMNVANIGEVDYLDKKFYYNGIEDNPNDLNNISKTNANKVVDYICNSMKFSKEEQSDKENWNTKGFGELMQSTEPKEKQAPEINLSLIEKDYINRQYALELNTYNTVLVTEKLSKETVPIVNENGEAISDIIDLNVSTDITSSSEENKLAYNNLAEIIEVSNSLGRRCRFSRVGNEEMADQSLGNNAKDAVLTSVDRVKPHEVDVDSAQKILILPPTGVRVRNY